MTLLEFKNTLTSQAPPASVNTLLQALWYEAKGNWHRAHEIVQDLDSRDAAWIHAYLHRKEGDLGNASYWYRLAGRNVSSTSLTEEWENIVSALL